MGDHAVQEIDLYQIYMKNLAVYGTRGMPAWKYPRLLDMVARGQVDLSPLLDRTIALSGASAELRAMKGATPPGTAVITDFAA